VPGHDAPEIEKQQYAQVLENAARMAALAAAPRTAVAAPAHTGEAPLEDAESQPYGCSTCGYKWYGKPCIESSDSCKKARAAVPRRNGNKQENAWGRAKCKNEPRYRGQSERSNRGRTRTSLHAL